MVDNNSCVDGNSVKFVDESSVVVENTALKLEGVDKKAVVYQRMFSLFKTSCVLMDPLHHMSAQKFCKASAFSLEFQKVFSITRTNLSHVRPEQFW